MNKSCLFIMAPFLLIFPTFFLNAFLTLFFENVKIMRNCAIRFQVDFDVTKTSEKRFTFSKTWKKNRVGSTRSAYMSFESYTHSTGYNHHIWYTDSISKYFIDVRLTYMNSPGHFKFNRNAKTTKNQIVFMLPHILWAR